MIRYLYNPFLLSVICKICRRIFDIHWSKTLPGGSQNPWDTSALKTSLEDKARQNTISIWNWSQNIGGHSQNVVMLIAPFYYYKNCNGNLQLMFIIFFLLIWYKTGPVNEQISLISSWSTDFLLLFLYFHCMNAWRLSLEQSPTVFISAKSQTAEIVEKENYPYLFKQDFFL